jgi:phosphoglycolate phosphatase-like HAD superfamily hydrolase|tara:strand:+ start:297 stop:944 length:648 start_codon:yes stop_codon:yes gene_type:complete
MSLELLSKADVIFWDFDGVIKESSAIKSLAFEEMFSKYGNEVLEKVVEHHQLNGGISREVKIPLYFSKFVGFSLTSQETEDRCLEYSKLVVQKVIDAPWVAGILDYLKSNSFHQRFVLITGTPYMEIIEILTALDIIDCFQTVYGSPTTKIKALNQEIQSDTDVSKCLFIGDTLTDYEAASAFEVPFLLRETEDNKKLFMSYTGLLFNDFQTLNE